MLEVLWLILKYSMAFQKWWRKNTVLVWKKKKIVAEILRCTCMQTWGWFLGNFNFLPFLIFGIFIKRIIIKKHSVNRVFLSVYLFSCEELFHSDTQNWFFILKVLWKSINNWQFHLIFFRFCKIDILRQYWWVWSRSSNKNCLNINIG